MTTNSPESLALLGRAAELRATGVPWSDAATQLTVGQDELRKLASEHARDYDRLMRRARNDVLRETLDAALTALRGHLASPDRGASMRAATTIVRYELARMCHGGKEAGSRLERDARRTKPTAEAREVRNQNVPESTKVPNQQEVNAAKNGTHSTASGSASPVAPKPTPSSPAPVAPPASTPAAPPAPTAAAVAGKNQAPLDDVARRRQRLVDDFALGRVPAVLGDLPTLEGGRLLSSWLAE
jgi:hypothetical protein